MSDIIRKQIDAYRPNFLEHGDTPRGTYQNNTTTQNERFGRLLRHLEEYGPEHFSVCDVGCGMADLHRYMNANAISHDYTGIEIVPEMVEQTRSKYPDIEVLDVDLQTHDFRSVFDFCVLSGTFNLPGDVSETGWEEFVLNTIERMYGLAGIGISFNLLTSYSTFKAKELFYADPAEIYDFLQKKLSRFIMVDTTSPLFELTFTVLRPEAVRARYDHPDLKKYFSAGDSA